MFFFFFFFFLFFNIRIRQYQRIIFCLHQICKCRVSTIIWFRWIQLISKCTRSTSKRQISSKVARRIFVVNSLYSHYFTSDLWNSYDEIAGHRKIIHEFLSTVTILQGFFLNKCKHVQQWLRCYQSPYLIGISGVIYACTRNKRMDGKISILGSHFF